MSTFRIGTSGWNYTSWRNRFYPKDCPQSKWLEYYCKYFDTVELNATFYRNFQENVYLRWQERVPPDFDYVIKVPGFITHRKLLLDAAEQVEEFCNKAQKLEDKLGLLLLQLSPRTPFDLIRLENKFKQFGKYTHKLVVEFRNDKWLVDDTYQLLRKYQVTYCNTDSPTTRLHAIATSQYGYIRLHGRQKMYVYNYSRRELEEVVAQANQLKKMGAKTVYIFFNNDVNANSVKNALTLKELFS